MSPGIESNVENRQGDGVEAKKTANSNRPSALKRNRLSANDKKAKREAVSADYLAGHPRLAIMLLLHLIKSQLNEFLTHLLLSIKITPIDTLYELFYI